MADQTQAQEFDGLKLKHWFFIFLCFYGGFKACEIRERNQRREALQNGATSEEVAKQTRKDLISKQFNLWSGSHKNLEALVKKSMHDPSSYEHIETTYRDAGRWLMVQTKYSGTNLMGGRVQGYVKAKVDTKTGNILEIIEER